MLHPLFHVAAEAVGRPTRHKTMFCVPCGFGYAESADSCYTSRPWRVSPHCVAANLVRAGR